MTKSVAKTLVLARDHRAEITYFLMVASAVMIFVYVANVYSVISNTVAMRSLENRMAEVSASVSELDAEYLRIAGKITPDIIGLHGFAQAPVTEYIKKPAGISRLNPPSGGSGHEL